MAAIRVPLHHVCVVVVCALLLVAGVSAEPPADLPDGVRVVLANAKPLEVPRGNRLPLYILPITNSLRGLDDRRTEEVVRKLDARGIGYSVDWNYGERDKSLAEGLRIGALQQRLGLRVAVHATAPLHSFFNGDPDTLHVGEDGETFSDDSFRGHPMGCPFALGHRYAVIKEQVEFFLREYKKAGVAIDFIFADWEIDGPIEWNDAWKNSKKCRRCREHLTDIEDFREFQSSLRRIRSDLQRVAFGENVTSYFPQALVGNYAVYPHNGQRYWYDYFEKPDATLPFQSDQKAMYREWFHEFDLTGYTFAMPVVYTWYSTFSWYDWDVPDYRWFYNMLLTGSNAGEHTRRRTPIITFVHWHTTAPPKKPDPAVEQFSAAKYQELLWHLLLRGHDGLFLWCPGSELAEEVRLVHEVYAQSLHYKEFLDHGEPLSFAVPEKPGPVVSGLKLGDKVLALRTDFDGASSGTSELLAGGETLTVSPAQGLQVLRIAEPRRDGYIRQDGARHFPIGFYEFPKDNEDLLELAAGGVNLVRCHSKEHLDRVGEAGMMGWVSLNIAGGPTDAFRAQVKELRDHPALAVWEGPDEIVWTFTAYSYLAERAGFTREEWRGQKPKAVAYAKKHAADLMPKMRAAIDVVRELDPKARPFWINEAANSDVTYVRQYMDSIDITGCDYYPVKSTPYDLQTIGRVTERWNKIGRGKPVWMVLQAFSWHTAHATRGRKYPTFAESRFMAYDAIAHGARGILYWGSQMIDSPEFRTALLSLTAELAALDAFLVAPQESGVHVDLIDEIFDEPGNGVAVVSRRSGDDWLLVLVNEDDHRHLGVEVHGLDGLNGREFQLLYGDETVRIDRGAFVTRMQPFETKVFCTGRQFESARRDGREF
jgi:hypothetical protein